MAQQTQTTTRQMAALLACANRELSGGYVSTAQGIISDVIRQLVEKADREES